MRIVMACPQLGDAFGQERVVKISTELLRAEGHSVFLVGDSEIGKLPTNDGAALVPGISGFHTLSDPFLVHRQHAKVLGFLKQVKPDLVHLHDFFDFRLLDTMARRYPVVLTAHTVAPTCPSSARLVSNAPYCKTKSGWRCVRLSRDQRCLSFLKSDPHRYHAVHNYLLRRRTLQSGARAVIAVSSYVERLLINDGWPAALIQKVPNPVPHLHPIRLDSTPPGLLVFAGRLTPLKGLDVALRALALVSDSLWTLWVCGDGPERNRMESLARELGLEKRVCFRGRTSPEETYQILASATAVLAPNRGPETFGLSVVEACVLGVPVIASQVPALDEWIREKQTGYVFEAGNVDALSKAIQDVLDHPEQARSLASAAKNEILEKVSPERHLERLLKAYSRAMDHPKRRSAYHLGYSEQSTHCIPPG